MNRMERERRDGGEGVKVEGKEKRRERARKATEEG